MKRVIVELLTRLDAAADEVLYRPAVVKAFAWLPRWWSCDLAKLSIALDTRWRTGVWVGDENRPGPQCEACGRRASVNVLDFVAIGLVHTCAWCELVGPVLNEDDVRRALARAGAESVAWRWRARP